MSRPQLELFAPGQTTAVLPLTPIPAPEPLTALASALPRALWLGTMSWSYPGWIGILYARGTPEKELARRALSAYSAHPMLRAVEIDRSLYEALSAETYALFAAQVPADFRFVAKAHQDCTSIFHAPHQGSRAGQRNPRLLDAAWAADAVVGPFASGLGAKAGPLVFQFPPQQVRSPERFADALHDFLRKLPRGPLYAVELRNRELLTSRYAQALAAGGAVHCHNAWGTMPSVLEQREALPQAARRVLVARWLTRPGDTHEAARARYLPFNRLVEEDLATRGELVELVGKLPEAESFVMISNKAEGCAPESLFRFAHDLAFSRS